MDVREKLMALLRVVTCPNAICNFCEHFKNKDACEKHKKEVIADNMIAHGVTVQEWISVDDMLPEPETDVIAFVGDYIDILSYRYDRRGNLAFMYMDDSGWWHERIRPSVTHWCAMPQPPKGE